MNGLNTQYKALSVTKIIVIVLIITFLSCSDFEVGMFTKYVMAIYCVIRDQCKQLLYNIRTFPCQM